MKKHEIIYEVEKKESVRDIIEHSVNKYPDNIAFTVKNNGKYKNITYLEFQDNIKALGTALLNISSDNMRVALIGKNSYEWAISYYATLATDNTIVPLDKGLPVQEIETLLKRSKADILIFEDKYIDIVNDIKNKDEIKLKEFICISNENETNFRNLNDLIKLGNELIKNRDTKYENKQVMPDETRIILFTSGTTSISKAVMLSNKNVAVNNWALNSVEKLYDTDVYMAFLPFHHTFGSAGLLTFLSNGSKIVFCDGLRYIKQNLAEYGVTVFVSVPLIIESMYKKIREEVSRKGLDTKVNIAIKATKVLNVETRRKIFKEILDGLGGKLRLVINGGAAVDPKALEGFVAFGITTLQGYGLTETSPIITMENDTHIKFGSVGLVLPNLEVKIENQDKNEIGEIIAKGPSIMGGYFENTEATNDVLIDGWFHTGDLGKFDKEGYLYITGRKKNVIVLKNGKNVFPEELEIELSNNPIISEVLVYDSIEKDGDSMLCAKIVYNKEYVENKYPNITYEEIKEKIWNEVKKFNKTMTNYKHIKKIEVTDEPMEKTTTNKIKRFVEINKIK